MLDIVISPNNVLLEQALPCKVGDPALKELAANMAKTMYHYNGVGLAGPQVGKLLRIIVIDTKYRDEDNERNPITLINPEIIELSDEVVESSEGCLSCPGIMAPVQRHKYAKVKYFDLDGNEQFIEGEDLLAFCLQHEIDHLDGKTIFQTAKPEERLQLLADYQKCLDLGIKPGEFPEDE